MRILLLMTVLFCGCITIENREEKIKISYPEEKVQTDLINETVLFEQGIWRFKKEDNIKITLINVLRYFNETNVVVKIETRKNKTFFAGTIIMVYNRDKLVEIRNKDADIRKEYD